MATTKRVPSNSWTKAAIYGEYRKARKKRSLSSGNNPGWIVYGNTVIPTTLTKKAKNPICPWCAGDTIKNGWTSTEWAAQRQRYRCKECGQSFTEKDLPKKEVTKKPAEVKKPKTKEKPFVTRTLNELKLEKEVKDLKAEITKKNVQMSNLKNKITKLQNHIETEKKIEEDRVRFIADNEDFLEIV